MNTATTVSVAQREPQLLGETIMVIGDSAGTASRRPARRAAVRAGPPASRG
jgi:hypothetical protein